MKGRKKFKTVEEYIKSLPGASQAIVREVRQTIQEAAPAATERISYNIPAFELKGGLVWYAAFQHHVGFYPRISGINAFQKELAAYEQSKGTIRFPLEKPMPHALIAKLVKYRVKENLKMAKEKEGARKKK